MMLTSEANGRADGAEAADVEAGVDVEAVVTDEDPVVSVKDILPLPK